MEGGGAAAGGVVTLSTGQIKARRATTTSPLTVLAMHRERVTAETVEVATSLLLMAAEGLVENADVLGSKDAARQFFDAMRWSSSAAPPTLPFPAGTVARLLRAAQQDKERPTGA